MKEGPGFIWPQKFQFDELNRIMITHYESEIGLGLCVFDLDDFNHKFDLFSSLSSTVQVWYGK